MQASMYGFINSIFRVKDILMEQISNRDRMLIMDNLFSDKWNGIYLKLENSCRYYREFEHNKCSASADLPAIGWSESIVSRIAQIRTDLNVFSEHEIKCLVYHGETLAETILAKWHYALYNAMFSLPSYQAPEIPDSSETQIFHGLRNSHKFLST
jgi:hypothetical protein